MTPTIHSIHTPCKECVFALYENITQTGCALNYLDIYKTNNTEVLEAYDQEKEFYVINDKKCIGYREPKWFKQFENNTDSLEDKISLYHSTNKISYLAVINLRTINPESLDNILKNLMSANILPQKIIFVRYRDDKLSFTYDSIEKLVKKHDIQLAWRIQTMLDSSIEYDEVLHQIVMGNIKYRFILSIDDNNCQPKTIIDRANDIVHKELAQFMVLSNENKKCKLFSGAVYRFGVANHQDIFEQESNYKII